MAVIADIKGEMREVSPRTSISGKDAHGRLPTPYPSSKFVWGRERDIGKIPSVSAGELTTGNERTLSPQIPSVMNDVFTRSSSELTSRRQTSKPQNREEFRAYDPRVHAPFVKMAYDRLRLLPQTLKRNRILAQRYSRRR